MNSLKYATYIQDQSAICMAKYREYNRNVMQWNPFNKTCPCYQRIRINRVKKDASPRLTICETNETAEIGGITY